MTETATEPVTVTSTAARLIGAGVMVELTRTEALHVAHTLRDNADPLNSSLARQIIAGCDLYPRVVDDTHRNDLPTGRVLVSCPAGATDTELVDAAGYDPCRHFGRTVTRHDDGMATVALWND